MTINPKDYMQDGWDRSPVGSHPYKRGSRHNKIGMTIMWTYYIISVSYTHLTLPTSDLV